MIDEEHVLDNLAAYTLGILDSSEMESVDDHLLNCAFCRDELKSYLETVGKLSLAAPAAVPPDGLKDRILNGVKAASGGTPVSDRQTFGARLGGFFQRTAPVWAFASFILVIGLLVSSFFLWRTIVDTGPSGGMRVIEMAGAEAAPEATGILVMSRDGHYGTLVVDGLTPLGEDQQYQLWLMESGERDSGGVFSVSDDGYGYVGVKSPLALQDYDSFGVTVEPAGGSPGPTGPRVLAGSAPGE
jgi:anti-sigma-K factor RskA